MSSYIFFAEPVMGHPTRAFNKGGKPTNPKMIGLSEKLVNHSCSEIIRQDKKIMGFRLPLDQMSPPRIMEKLGDRLNDNLEVFEPSLMDCVRNGPLPFKHSLLTSDYPANADSKPNYVAVKAYERLREFLSTNLGA